LTDFKQKAKDLKRRILRLQDHFNLEEKESRLQELEKELNDKDIWADHQKVRKISQEVEYLKEEKELWQKINDSFIGLEEMIKDVSFGDDGLSFIEEQYSELEGDLKKIEEKIKFSGPYDRGGAVFSFQAGAGGTDAQDWTEMLLRMYLRFFEKEGWKVSIVDRTDGSEAGIKKATVIVTGGMIYGRMKNESGVHRLVRLSPFNADHLRQTSFAMVEITPLIEDKVAVKINEKDLRIDTFRSSGAGGQSVNTTDSAVRITHLPTGLMATCQNERSQLRNKEKAMTILKGRLAKLLEEEQVKKVEELKGERKAVEWGSQIRSYVLHPYKMVKDHRSNKQTTAVEKVLDGDLELIM